MKYKTTIICLAFILTSVVVSAATTEVFRYTDSKGRAVFTDRPLSGSQYNLVWRTTLARLDAQFERTPHLPLQIATENEPNNRSKKRTNRDRVYRRKSEFAPMIQRIAKNAGVNVHLIHAVVQAESGYNPKARSHAGAIGLMQLMPATAKRYGVNNIWDPEQNLTGGTQYLRDLLELFDNDLRLAVAAYNAGEGAVLKYGNQIPPYRETREYVKKVIKNYKAMRG
jgi:soluble lytic murein transglycosylase-like protein